MPADDHDPEVDVDALTERLKAVVEDRRRAGEYPADLEWQLDDHFRRITARAADMGDVQRLLDDVRLASEMGRHRIEYTSGVPGGQQVHKAIGKVVGRQTEGALNQVNDFARAVLLLLQALVESRPVHETVLPDITARLDSVLERMADYERVPPGSDAVTRALGARLERLENAVRDMRTTPPYSRQQLRAALIAPRDTVLARYRPLAERFRGLSPVVDLGCGGGEMLQLLSEIDVVARGVDVDPEAIEMASAAGLTATRADARDYLGSIADETLGGVFAGHLLEQMPSDDSADLLRVASQKLRPGGLLIIVGHDPSSVNFQASHWFVDPANLRPVPAALVEFLLGKWGFTDVRVEAIDAEASSLEAIIATR